MGLSAAPNPFSTRTVLRLIASHAGPVGVVLFDAFGRDVRHMSLDACAGENNLPVERDGLPPGLYLCRVTGNDGTHVVSLIVQ